MSCSMPYPRQSAKSAMEMLLQSRLWANNSAWARSLAFC